MVQPSTRYRTDHTQTLSAGPSLPGAL
uniref:Uncharacterized protein n=1 Tax=Anguilla anguilla TaxID=7936 RepID=A0A0E9WCX0_ANGAN